MQLKVWFAAAFTLSFLAGGGAGLVADRLMGHPDAVRRIGTAEGYVKAFDEQIGIEDARQRQALRAAYERRLTDLRELTQRLISENREDFQKLDREFFEQVSQLLEPDQRLRWQEKTGWGSGEGGPADTDAGEDVDEAPIDGQGK